MFVSIDDALPSSVLERVRAADGIISAQLVELPPL
jgi:hypothetical protein